MAEARTDEKLCCLTFDDGPSPHTGALAETLAEYGAKATFFVTAQPANTDYLPALGELAAAGHQIALHSASHDYARIYASPEAFWLDIKALRQALAPWVEVEGLCWLRFPGGSTNTVSHRYGGRQIMQKLTAEAAEKGYRWIDWNVCAEDATAARPNADEIFENVRRGAEGRDVCVVLLQIPPAAPKPCARCPASWAGLPNRATGSARWRRCSLSPTAAERGRIRLPQFPKIMTPPLFLGINSRFFSAATSIVHSQKYWDFWEFPKFMTHPIFGNYLFFARGNVNSSFPKIPDFWEFPKFMTHPIFGN